MHQSENIEDFSLPGTSWNGIDGVHEDVPWVDNISTRNLVNGVLLPQNPIPSQPGILSITGTVKNATVQFLDLSSLTTLH